MAGGFRGALGKSLFDGWMLKRRLAERRRPRLTRVLAWLLAASGLVLLAQGVVVTWFLPEIVPAGWGIDLVNGLVPWTRSTQWLAGALLMVIGLEGVASGAQMTRHRQVGAYLGITFILALLAAGAVFLGCGICFEAGWLIGFGSWDIASGLVLAALLGLCWYTLDPLGLHWDPGA